jgi:hypothetical protein
MFSLQVIPSKLKKRFQLPWKNNPNQLEDITSHKNKYEQIKKGYFVYPQKSMIIIFSS